MFKFKINSWDKRIVLYAMRVLTEHGKIVWNMCGNMLTSDDITIEILCYGKNDLRLNIWFKNGIGEMEKAFTAYHNRNTKKILNFVKNKENREYKKNEEIKTEELRKKLFDMFVDKRIEPDYEL